MGATISGSEIDVWKAPKAESYVLCNLPEDYPKRTKKILIRFDKGKPVAINGSKVITFEPLMATGFPLSNLIKIFFVLLG